MKQNRRNTRTARRVTPTCSSCSCDMHERSFTFHWFHEKSFGICIGKEIDRSRTIIERSSCFTCRIKRSYREGATPTRFGTRPLNSPGTPSYLRMYRKAAIILGRFCLTFDRGSIRVVVVLLDDEFKFRLCNSFKNEFCDDWYRVLMTSNGHVKTAPNVPASLQTKQIQNDYFFVVEFNHPPANKWIYDERLELTCCCCCCWLSSWAELSTVDMTTIGQIFQ